jgi:hypothetical protein
VDWRRSERIVDKNVQPPASDLGYRVVAGLDTLGLGDVERDGAHAESTHLGEHRRISRCGDDMQACPYSKFLLILLRVLAIGTYPLRETP